MELLNKLNRGWIKRKNGITDGRKQLDIEGILVTSQKIRLSSSSSLPPKWIPIFVWFIQTLKSGFKGRDHFVVISQKMNSLAIRVSKLLRSSPISPPLGNQSPLLSLKSSGSVAVTAWRSWFSTGPIDEEGLEEDFEETISERPAELQPHGVDPRKGWGFRGVHRVNLIFNLLLFSLLKIVVTIKP